MSEPSQYVSVYISRRQAEFIRRCLLWEVGGRAKTHISHAALKRIDEALKANDGSATSCTGEEQGTTTPLEQPGYADAGR